MAEIRSYRTFMHYVKAALMDEEVAQFCVPTDEAAECLGVTRQRIQQLEAEGRLDCVRVQIFGKRGRLFRADQVQALRREMKGRTARKLALAQREVVG